MAVCHLEEFPSLLTGGRGNVEKQERHLLTEVDENLEDVFHHDVDGHHLAGVDDARHLDLDTLLGDGDLVFGKNLVIADPDGSAVEGTTVVPYVLHDVHVCHSDCVVSKNY